MLCTLSLLSSSHAYVAAHVKLLIRDRIFIINLFQIQVLGGMCADELPQRSKSWLHLLCTNLPIVRLHTKFFIRPSKTVFAVTGRYYPPKMLSAN